MEYKFVVTSLSDPNTPHEQQWAKEYDNALDAVTTYNKMNDYGFAGVERICTLIEPSGKVHSKVFKTPYVNDRVVREMDGVS